MITINKQSKNPAPRGPRVLHIRRVRQWHGEKGIAQKELSQLTGVSCRVLREYESLRRLPKNLENLLRIAKALHRSVESLIDPRAILPIIEDVAARRNEHNQSRKTKSNSRCRSNG